VKKSPSLTCHVAAAREAAGETQVGLARKLGVSRQALSLVESGQSIPSTALALRLATVLGRSVEELFVLTDAEPRGTELSVHWVNAPANDTVSRGLMGRIGGRLVAHPLAATDLTAADIVAQPGKNRRRVTTLRATGDPNGSDRLFIAGCAPALGLFCDHLEKAAAPVRASWIHATTAGALTALARKEVQVAGLHYPPAAPNPSDRRARPGPRRNLALTFATWQQGLLVRRGDRRAPRSVAQLGARGVRLVRREAGASANRLLDAQLSAAGIAVDISAALIARGHFGVGAAVALGAADVGVAAEHAALAHDLEFVPLDEERFDLTFDASFVDDPRYQRLGDLLSSHAFRTDLQGLGGYDTKNTGSVPVGPSA
jgi:putative molybdopterin biosynthesis protein